MNDWIKVWGKRKTKVDLSLLDIKDAYREMRFLDGYDIDKKAYSWTELKEQFDDWNQDINFFKRKDKEQIQSVFEVGCGSGPNLLLYQYLFKDKSGNPLQVGGVDYSKNLISYAHKVIRSSELYCDEAINLRVDNKYDAIISYSVFHYFPDLEYADSVLQKMYEKANDVIAILDVHDIEKKQSFLDHRKMLTPDYETMYKNLPKLFYSKSYFLDFADKHRCDIKFTYSNVDGYWNNDYVFNCFIYK